MALKPDKQIDAYELGYFINEVATRGVIVSKSTAASGAQLDDADALVTVKAASSGALPIGVLLGDVVDIDLTRQPVNWHKQQLVKGDKAPIATKGWVVTNAVVSATAGTQAVLASSGYVTNRAVGNSHDENLNPTVGRFRSDKDQNGYARLYVDL